MNLEKLQINNRANLLFKSRYSTECRRVNQFIFWLMIVQWVAGIGFALFLTPLTWVGQTFEVHVHVWAALLLGGSISGFSILWTKTFPDSAHSRHVVAISQMLWSALLIHLSGGRIETHFHVFASLAILSIYRDWKILVTATVVVAIDHFVRGVFYPLSAFGIATESPYRWMEHAGWVLFEVSFLIPGCMRLKAEISELCVRQVEIEEAKKSVDISVENRTRELSSANERLAIKTQEAEKLALVARYTDNGVVITDDQARIEWVNEGFERITGYQFCEIEGKRPSEFLHGPESDPNQIAAMNAAIQAKAGYDFEMIKYRKNGEPFWMAIEARPIRDENGNATRFILIESDISERVKAGIERQKLNEQLVDASRAAGIAEVATGVLHNVGNVLNSVNVSATVIKKQIRNSAIEKLEKLSSLIAERLDDFGDFVARDERGQRIPEYILKVTDVLRSERNSMSQEFDDLVTNVEHIKEIVAVQQQAATVSGLKQTLSANDIIEDAITANKGTLANHRVSVVRKIQDELPVLVSDKGKLLQILINLIHNAKDAVVDFGSSHPEISIEVSAEHDAIYFDIADNGIGIHQDQLGRIFQHGFTTKESGHGFGLHCSANAATELGGSLVASSDGIGTGASFRLSLPVHSKTNEADSKVVCRQTERAV